MFRFQSRSSIVSDVSKAIESWLNRRSKSNRRWRDIYPFSAFEIRWFKCILLASLLNDGGGELFAPSLHQRSYFLFLYVFDNVRYFAQIRYTRSKFNYENIFKDIKNVEKFIRKRLNSYKVFNKIKQLEKEIFYQHTIKSQRATDVLKYPTKFTEMEKSKVARCRIGWTMDSMTRVHLYVAPVIDLFGKVFEENCTTAFAKSIPCIFYVNRPRSFYILPRNVDCRNRVVYFSIEVLLFILFFFLLQKENNNCVM